MKGPANFDTMEPLISKVGFKFGIKLHPNLTAKIHVPFDDPQKAELLSHLEIVKDVIQVNIK
jgi:hypothetical protein